MQPVIYNCLAPAPAGAPPLYKEIIYNAEAHDVNLIRVAPGTVKPPHAYTAGDAFMLVLSGRLDLQVEGQTYPLTPGTLALVPRGAARGFTAGPEGAVFLAVHLRA